MSIDRKTTFFLGIFIFVIPFLGFPSMWKAILTVLSGIFLIFLSVKVNIPKKFPRSRVQKEKITPIVTTTEPMVSPRNDTVEVMMHHTATPDVVVKTVKKSKVTKKNNGPVV